MKKRRETAAQYALHAIETGAEHLDLNPLVLAKRLQDGEIAYMVRLLHAAAGQVSSPRLRHRIEDLLSGLTDGRMPMFQKPDTELDFALETLRRQRAQSETYVPEEPESDAATP